MSEIPLPTQLRCAYVAVQHLQYGTPMLELASELGVSRFTISRMIDRARHAGLVEVVTHLPEPVDLEVSALLQRAFALDDAIVAVPPSADEQTVRAAIGQVAANLLRAIIADDDVVGVGPGRTILETAGHLTTLAACDIVQLTGVASDDPVGDLRALMKLSEASGGRLFPVHAPLVTTDSDSRRAITAQPAIRSALHRMDYLDRAVLTVGGWPDSSLLARQFATMGELDGLLGRGVVAEIGCTLLDGDGHEIDGYQDRFVGITSTQLSSVPTTIGLGGGPGKERALLATLRSGLVNTVVTDITTARAVLDNM
ncbi:DNA-binding transcriptional regulator [Microbacterium kribbense]|uniref:DNA-binding transcriptional regulator n=1 Tax=Microbacterium kribbense TaxID=433645 RepID=A0ABP7GGG4_9MICO